MTNFSPLYYNVFQRGYKLFSVCLFPQPRGKFVASFLDLDFDSTSLNWEIVRFLYPPPLSCGASRKYILEKNTRHVHFKGQCLHITCIIAILFSHF